MNTTELIVIFVGASAIGICSSMITRRYSGYTMSAGTAQRLAVLLVLAWTALVGTMAILRHLAFKSGAYDLGIFDQVIWNSAQGRLFENSVMADSPSFLGHHFSPILLALVPLYWVNPSPATLLAVQALLLALAGLPIFWLARDTLQDPVLALAVLVAYLLHPATTYVALFDFHEIALAIPLLSSALYLLQRRRYRLFGASLALTFLVKEEMGLAGAAIGIYLAFSQRRWVAGLGLTAVGTLWTFLLVRFVIPGFHPTGEYFFAEQYARLGQSPEGMVLNLLREPTLAIQTMLSPSKLVYLQQMFAPLGAVPFLGWPALVITVPTFIYVLLNEFIPAEVIRYQYSAPLLPAMLLATIVGLGWLRRRLKDKWSALAPGLAAFMIGAALIGSYLWGPLPWASNFDWQRYQSQRRLDVARELIAQIPAEASVIAQFELVPQLSHRRTIQVFGAANPALRPDYYLLDIDAKSSRWPLSSDWDKPYLDLVARVKSDGEYHVVAEREGFVLARRDVPDLGQVVETIFGDQISLVGYRTASRQITAGNTVDLTLYWQAKRKLGNNYTLFVHLVDIDEKSWGQRDGYPTGEYLPTSQWESGRLLRSDWSVPVHRETPPGEYHLRAGLYDLDTMQRLPVTGSGVEASNGNSITLGTIEVVAEKR